MSNLPARFITRFAKDRNAKLGQKGAKWFTWPNFEICEPPLYLRNCWS